MIWPRSSEPADRLAPRSPFSCEVAVDPGIYTIEFADENPQMIEVPSDQEVCLAGGVYDDV